MQAPTTFVGTIVGELVAAPLSQPEPASESARPATSRLIARLNPSGLVTTPWAWTPMPSAAVLACAAGMAASAPRATAPPAPLLRSCLRVTVLIFSSYLVYGVRN